MPFMSIETLLVTVAFRYLALKNQDFSVINLVNFMMAVSNIFVWGILYMKRSKSESATVHKVRADLLKIESPEILKSKFHNII